MLDARAAIVFVNYQGVVELNLIKTESLPTNLFFR